MKAVLITVAIIFAWVSGVSAGDPDNNRPTTIGSVLFLMAAIACGVNACGL